MGNAPSQGGGLRGAAQKLSAQFAEWREEEARLELEFKGFAPAKDGDDSEERRKELAKDIVRVRASIQGLSNGIDSQRAKLEEEERRLVTKIQEQHVLDDRVGQALVRARKNIQNFDAAFAELQLSLKNWKQDLEKRKEILRNPHFVVIFSQAIEHDNNRDYENALTLYEKGIRHANDELLPDIRNVGREKFIRERLSVYTKRAQELRDYLAQTSVTKG